MGEQSVILNFHIANEELNTEGSLKFFLLRENCKKFLIVMYGVFLYVSVTFTWVQLMHAQYLGSKTAFSFMELHAYTILLVFLFP